MRELKLQRRPVVIVSALAIFDQFRHQTSGDDRVLELIDQGIGKEFAPNGRRFKEWVAVEEHDASLWESLILEAKSFVGGV